MTRTITIPAEPYEQALRDVLQSLKEKLEAAAAAVEQLDIRPTAKPMASDAYAHLLGVRRTVEALEALGWPADGEQVRRKVAELYGPATAAGGRP